MGPHRVWVTSTKKKFVSVNAGADIHFLAPNLNLTLSTTCQTLLSPGESPNKPTRSICTPPTGWGLAHIGTSVSMKESEQRQSRRRLRGREEGLCLSIHACGCRWRAMETSSNLWLSETDNKACVSPANKKAAILLLKHPSSVFCFLEGPRRYG